MSDLSQLVGEDAEHLWSVLPYKKLYYKDGSVYGIIGVITEDGFSVIYSMAKNGGKFTNGMLKDIFKLYKVSNIALITDDESSFKYIASVLSRYNFEFFQVESEVGKKFMYSLHYV